MERRNGLVLRQREISYSGWGTMTCASILRLPHHPGTIILSRFLFVRARRERKLGASFGSAASSSHRDISNRGAVPRLREKAIFLADTSIPKCGAIQPTRRLPQSRRLSSICSGQPRTTKRSPNPQRYGHGIVTWCVYQNVACGVNMLQTKESLKDVFDLTLPDCQAYRWKRYMSAFYEDLSSEILRSILNSPVIHIDETTVN